MKPIMENWRHFVNSSSEEDKILEEGVKDWLKNAAMAAALTGGAMAPGGAHAADPPNQPGVEKVSTSSFAKHPKRKMISILHQNAINLFGKTEAGVKAQLQGILNILQNHRGEDYNGISLNTYYTRISDILNDELDENASIILKHTLKAAKAISK